MGTVVVVPSRSTASQQYLRARYRISLRDLFHRYSMAIAHTVFVQSHGGDRLPAPSVVHPAAGRQTAMTTRGSHQNSPLEGNGFEPSVPHKKQPFLASPVRSRNSPSATKSALSCRGPMVQIHLPPADIRVRTRLTEGKGGSYDRAARVLAIRTLSVRLAPAGGRRGSELRRPLRAAARHLRDHRRRPARWRSRHAPAAVPARAAQRPPQPGQGRRAPPVISLAIGG